MHEPLAKPHSEQGTACWSMMVLSVVLAVIVRVILAVADADFVALDEEVSALQAGL